MIKDPVKEIGTLVKSAREKQNISVDDLSRQSRVATRHIENIEGAVREELPEETYLIGFLTKILKSLKVDDVEAKIEQFKKQESDFILQTMVNESVELEESDLANAQSGKQYFKVYHLYILFIVIFLVITWSLLKKQGQETKEKKVIKEKLVQVKKAKEALKKKALLEKKELEAKQEVSEQEAKENKKEDKQAKLKEEKPKKTLEKVSYKNILAKGSGDTSLFLRIKAAAWFQIIGIDAKKILYEGDVLPTREPNQFKFRDDTGFVLASGNAAAFEVNTGEGPYLLGESGELIKWYYPRSAKKVYLKQTKKKD